MKTTTIRLDEQTARDIETIKTRMRFASGSQAIRWALHQVAGQYEDDAYPEKLQREVETRRARQAAETTEKGK